MITYDQSSRQAGWPTLDSLALKRGAQLRRWRKIPFGRKIRATVDLIFAMVYETLQLGDGVRRIRPEGLMTPADLRPIGQSGGGGSKPSVGQVGPRLSPLIPFIRDWRESLSNIAAHRRILRTACSESGPTTVVTALIFVRVLGPRSYHGSDRPNRVSTRDDDTDAAR